MVAACPRWEVRNVISLPLRRRAKISCALAEIPPSRYFDKCKNRIRKHGVKPFSAQLAQAYSGASLLAIGSGYCARINSPSHRPGYRARS